jgi:hypothetical protein
MAERFRHLIIGLICVLAFAQSAMGQAAAEKEVSLSFNVFALGGAEGLAFVPKKGVSAKGLRFYSAYRSPVYEYRGSPTLSFYDKTAENVSQPVAIYTIPEGSVSLLLLFFPREKPSADGIRYDVFGVEDSPAKTPAGSFSTINVSGREYVAQYGSTRITIPKGVGMAYPGKSHVVLRLASQVDGLWIPTGKHDFNMAKSDRVTLIFYPPASRTGVYPIIRRLVDGSPNTEDQESAVDLAQGQ